MMEQTTTVKLQWLLQSYENGYRDDVIDLVVDKLVDDRLNQIETVVQELQEHLDAYEQQYNMPTAEFLTRYEAGKLGDDADYFEWSSLYKLQHQEQAQLHEIKPSYTA